MSNERERTQTNSTSTSQQAPQGGAAPVVDVACAACHHGNAGAALFCEECGQALRSPGSCPACSAPSRHGADICEACGTWLLRGQCMFCYSPVAEQEAFCAECGNPASGITCPQCGHSSIFDFCKACHIPLSDQAKESIAQAAADPQLREMSSLIDALQAIGALPPEVVPPPQSKTQDTHAQDQARQLKYYRESLAEPAPAARPAAARLSLFSDQQKDQINQLNSAIEQEERRREEEEIRRRAEEERMRREAELRRQQELEKQQQLRAQLLAEMRKFAGKSFASNQEARRFFMALIAGLPRGVFDELAQSGLGWRCNAYDYVHDSPSECADPSRGGVWLMR